MSMLPKINNQTNTANSTRGRVRICRFGKICLTEFKAQKQRIVVVLLNSGKVKPLQPLHSRGEDSPRDLINIKLIPAYYVDTIYRLQLLPQQKYSLTYV